MPEGEDPLRAPGEFLFLDENGNLFVGNELDDWEIYQRFSPPEPPAAGIGGGYDGGLPQGYDGAEGDGSDPYSSDPYGAYGSES